MIKNFSLNGTLSLFLCVLALLCGSASSTYQGSLTSRAQPGNVTYTLTSITCNVILAPTITLRISFSPALTRQVSGVLQLANGTNYRNFLPLMTSPGASSVELRAKVPSLRSFADTYQVILVDATTNEVLFRWNPVTCPPRPTTPPPATLQSLTCRVTLIPIMSFTFTFPSPLSRAITGHLLYANGANFKIMTPVIPVGATSATVQAKPGGIMAFHSTYQVKLIDSNSTVFATFNSVTCPTPTPTTPPSH